MKYIEHDVKSLITYWFAYNLHTYWGKVNIYLINLYQLFWFFLHSDICICKMKIPLKIFFS